jgi:hypothetical protein
VKLRSISTYCGMCKSKPCIHPLLVLLPEPRQGYSQVLVSSIAVGFGLRITGMSLFRRLCSHVQPNDVKDPFHPQGCLLLGLLRFHPTLAADTATQNPRVGLIRSRSQQIDFRLLLTARRSQLSATDPTRKALAVIDGLTKEIERTPKVGT